MSESCFSTFSNNFISLYFVWAGRFLCGRTTFEGRPSCGWVIISTSLEHWQIECYLAMQLRKDETPDDNASVNLSGWVTKLQLFIDSWETVLNSWSQWINSRQCS